MDNQEKVPTTIFTGFLGSGKTTIITHIIEKLQNQGLQTIYIKNEIGDTDIDTKLLKEKGIKTKELLNGCICCTLVGPFVSSINTIINEFNPDRIIIEASGAADPSALALMVSSHPNLLRDGVIGIIDVVNFEGYNDLTITAKKQTEFTDLLVFNKIELASLEQKKKVVGYVRELNTHSPIVEAPEGKIDPQLVFGSYSKELEQLLKQASQSKTHIHDHIEQDHIEAFTLKIDKTYSRNSFENLLASLPKQIIRAKGIVHLSDTDLESKPYIFNSVAGRSSLTAAPATMKKSQATLVCIGYRINSLENEVAKLL